MKEGIMRPRHHLQRSLFEDRKTPDIPASQRRTLVHLIEGLLVEAVANGEMGTPTTETREAAHEQDHA
jgi:hypothetical protein